MSAGKKMRKQRDIPRRISESGEELCPVCNDVMAIFAVGRCDHIVCYKCSTRMRALCDQMYCAICRAEIPKVVFLRNRKLFEELNTQPYPVHRKYSIYFENQAIQSMFFELLDHVCPVCPDKHNFRTFDQLKTHMRKEHQFFYCELCVKHLKIFSHERKHYNRQKLAQHKRLGDSDDTSYKGHPLCQFCEERFLDNDELVRHLRKEHYYCHFCDADGISNQFYSDYDYLNQHYREEHFLCEEGECMNVQFTNAYRSEIDLKAHQASEHSSRMSKSEAKQARVLEIDFNYAPRGIKYDRGRGRRDRGRQDRGIVGGEDYEEVYKGGGNRDVTRPPRGRGGRSRDYRQKREAEDTAMAISASLTDAKNEAAKNKSGYQEKSEDFPMLDGKTVQKEQDSNEVAKKDSAQKSNSTAKKDPAVKSKSTLANKVAMASNFTVADGDVDDRDFPALGGGSKPLMSGFGANSYKSRGAKVWNKNDDFPALPMSRPNTAPEPRHYSQPTPRPKPMAPEPAAVTPSFVQSSPPDTLEDFPSLSSISTGLLGNTQQLRGFSAAANTSVKSTASKSSSNVVNIKQKNEFKNISKQKQQQQQPKNQHSNVKKTSYADVDPYWNDKPTESEPMVSKITVVHQPKQTKPLATKPAPNVTSKDFPALGKPVQVEPQWQQPKSAQQTEPQWQQPKARHHMKSHTSFQPTLQPAIITEDDVDFPSLGKNPKKSQQLPGNNDDFPSLGKQNNVQVTSSWGPSPKEEIHETPKTEVEEFTKVKLKGKKKWTKPIKASQIHIVGSPSHSEDSAGDSDNEESKVEISKKANKKAAKKSKKGKGVSANEETKSEEKVEISPREDETKPSKDDDKKLSVEEEYLKLLEEEKKKIEEKSKVAEKKEPAPSKKSKKKKVPTATLR